MISSTKCRFKNKYQLSIWIIFLIISFFSTISIILDSDKPEVYGNLFILPLMFMICSIVCNKVYMKFFENIGVTVLFILLFVRLVVNPFLMSRYGYETSIASFPNEDMIYAIMLLVYEEIIIFFVLNYKCYMSILSNDVSTVEIDKKEHSYKVYGILLGLLLICLAFCICISPQIMNGYRTIFEISEELFSSYEDTQLVNLYGTSIIKKFAIVTGNYIMRVILLILPAYLIITISKKKSVFRRTVSFICCFIPLFFIGGVIARSLIYIICLLILYYFIYDDESISKRMAHLIILASILVISWWTYKSVDEYGLKELTESLNAYFTGVNNVYGSMKLESDFSTKFSYFIHDYINAIPYGGTIFKTQKVLFSEFFNEINGVRGQIAPTIGMGRYYFGFIFAPIYSIIFACISFKSAEKIRLLKDKNYLTIVRLLLTSIYFAMAIVMYNIPITMTTFFTILLPMNIMEKIAYRIKWRGI